MPQADHPEKMDDGIPTASDTVSIDDFNPEKLLQSPHAGLTCSVNLKEIDSGQALQTLLLHYTARIRQLKEGLSFSQKENDHMVDESLMQNLELINLNKNLEYKVKERTRELGITNVKLEVTNQNLETANRLLEEQAQQLKELDETKEALMHMVVHDMKNPLTAILGTLTLFKKNDYTLPQDIHCLLKNSHGHGIKLLSMIEEFLMISRMKTKEFKLKSEQVNLIKVIHTSIDMMKQTVTQKNLRFDFQPPEPTLDLQIDIQIIERVINNLLNNAIKYSSKNQAITLSVERLATSVQIAVTNRGPVIPRQYHLKIFELFSRVNKDDKQYSGTGLGLAFSKLAIKAHGGTLEVISPAPPQDDGACFCFTLPFNTLDIPNTD
ncbi:hypothetical protein K8S19_07015 [bacterium]|nr:hypothetical protein [bacterium]